MNIVDEYIGVWMSGFWNSLAHFTSASKSLRKEPEWVTQSLFSIHASVGEIQVISTGNIR